MHNIILTLLFGLIGCQSNFPKFDENNAFQYLLDQCDFGPRNPGSDGYYACRQFIIDELDAYADEIVLQDFSYREQRDNQSYDFQNIIGRFNPDADFKPSYPPTGILVHGQTVIWKRKTTAHPSWVPMTGHPESQYCWN